MSFTLHEIIYHANGVPKGWGMFLLLQKFPYLKFLLPRENNWWGYLPKDINDKKILIGW